MPCGWSSGAAVPDPSSRQVETVLAANRAFYDALEAGDLDLLGALWLPGSHTLCVHPGAEPLRGTPAILRSWAAVMSAMLYMQFFLTDVEVALGPDDDGTGRVAMVSCTQNLLTAGDSGEETFSGAKAVASNVFVRTGTGWRMWSHHSSPVLTIVAEDEDDEDDEAAEEDER
jgi:ketosteroid isomerase-like protein